MQLPLVLHLIRNVRHLVPSLPRVNKARVYFVLHFKEGTKRSNGCFPSFPVRINKIVIDLCFSSVQYLLHLQKATKEIGNGIYV